MPGPVSASEPQALEENWRNEAECRLRNNVRWKFPVAQTKPATGSEKQQYAYQQFDSKYTYKIRNFWRLFNLQPTGVEVLGS